MSHDVKSDRSKAREQKGLSHEALARESNVPLKDVKDYENGNKIAQPNLVKIKRTLNRLPDKEKKDQPKPELGSKDGGKKTAGKK